MAKKRQKKRQKKPSVRQLRPTATELNDAIAEVTSHKAHIEAIIGDLEIATKRLRHAAREHEDMAQELRQRGVLDREVEKAINQLKATFRNGPVQINESLIKLAQDILQEQIRAVLHDQMANLVKELLLIVRKEVQTEAYDAMREALNDHQALTGSNRREVC